MNSPRGVIFDFNGTLFSDSQQQETAWRMFAKEAFGRKISADEFLEKVHGRNNSFIMRYLSNQALTETQISSFVAWKESIYRDLCRSDPVHFHLANGAVQLLDELKGRNISRTIATASQKSNVDFYIDSFGLEKWFDLDKIIYDDGAIPGKPAPDFYQRAASAIGVPAADCIVFEDAVSGIQSAYRADIGKIIAVAPEERRPFFEQMEQVETVIPDFYAFDRRLL